MLRLHVTFSNHIETLFSALAELIAVPVDSEHCLASEYVLLDNKVLGSWLNMQLAQKHGIAANIHYIQPSGLFWTLAKALLADELPAETPLLKDEMKWRLFALLGNEALLEQKSLQPVRNYLESGHNRPLKRHQLAGSIADLFDQYLIFRADWLLKWQERPAENVTQDNNEDWQKILWQNLTQSINGKSPVLHRAAIEQKLHRFLQREGVSAISKVLPFRRLFVFGISTMAPSMLQLLQLLARHIPVYLYVLNPCQEFWFDCKSSKEWLHSKQRKIQRDMPLLIGNALLLGNGQQVREFIEKIVADEGHDYQIDEHYLDPGSDSLLHCIQQDILQLTQGGELASLSPENRAIKNRRKVPARESARQQIPSVHIHSCHSAMREVEVLHDQLLDMFARDNTLRPRDIVVMMPQTGKYRPHIEAVFSGTAEKLPYHLTDLSMVEESPLLNSIDTLLGLPDSRLGLSEILAILEVPAIQRTFALDRDAYEKLKALLQKTGVRWGLDAAHRQAQGLPAYSEFSWEFAINRLLGGFAMNAVNEHDDAILLDIGTDGLPVMPLDDLEGTGTDILDGFLRFWQLLLHYRQKFRQEYTASVWSELMLAMLDDFFTIESDDELHALRDIRQQLQILRKAGYETWVSDTIAFAVVRDVLKNMLTAPSSHAHPWREGIKFCSLMPMRAVPFRVVYIIGMNQGEYPGRVEKKSFDLMRHHHRTGDRSRRVDDRWLFLEAMLSARDIFHVSYTGHDQRKNEERQPSVLVAELLDYLGDSYDAARESYLTQHPLQPFSQAYFLANKTDAGRRLVSYNRQAYAIASMPAADTLASKNLWPSSPASETVVDISLDEFVMFFAEPARWFLNIRHKAWLGLDDNAADDEELFGSDALDAWSARQTIRTMAQRNSGLSIHAMVETLSRQWRAQGLWPLGSAGDDFRKALQKDIDHQWLDAAQLLGVSNTVSVDFQLPTGQGILRISGNVSTNDQTFVEHSCSGKKAKSLLAFYIRSAVIAFSNKGIDKSQAFFFKKGGVDSIELQLGGEFHGKLLNELATLYMLYRHDGLPFLPELGYNIFHAAQEGGTTQAMINEAWYGDGRNDGLLADISQRAYYMQPERLQDSAFTQVALQVWRAITDWLGFAEINQKEDVL